MPAGRRRPSGAPPPLPRHIESSGLIWLTLAVVATGAAVAVFTDGLGRWAVDVTVIDEAMTREVAGARFPGLTVAGYALLLALIVLRRFSHLLVLVVSYKVLTVLTRVFVLVAHRPLPFGVPIRFRFGGFALPSVEIETVCAVIVAYCTRWYPLAGGGGAAPGPLPGSSR